MAEQNYYLPDNHRLHPSIANETLRMLACKNLEITPNKLMLPIFISDKDGKEEIESMPGVYRLGVENVIELLASQKSLKYILVFGVPTKLSKDEAGSSADSKDNPVMKALPIIKENFPHIIIAADVCLCAYTSHGHCGFLNKDGRIDNDASIRRIAQVAVSYAKAGADIVAPSDMMDGRISAIKQELRNAKLSHVSVLSYTAKFASCLYGPFRDAANSAPAHGDRKCYQLPPGSSGLALRAADRDTAEGADFLMVKPGGFYLDIARQIKDKFPNHPLFIYQVSGEYSMIQKSAQAKIFDLKTAVYESIMSMLRSGADVVISYYTLQILQWLEKN